MEDDLRPKEHIYGSPWDTSCNLANNAAVSFVTNDPPDSGHCTGTISHGSGGRFKHQHDRGLMKWQPFRWRQFQKHLCKEHSYILIYILMFVRMISAHNGPAFVQTYYVSMPSAEEAVPLTKQMMSQFIAVFGSYQVSMTQYYPGLHILSNMFAKIKCVENINDFNLGFVLQMMQQFS